VGQPIAVLYDPSAPDRGRVDSFLARYFAALLCGGLGGTALLLILLPLLLGS
jgi:hypothetical protein